VRPLNPIRLQKLGPIFSFVLVGLGDLPSYGEGTGQSRRVHLWLPAPGAIRKNGRKNPLTFGICIAHFGRTAPTSVPSFDSEPILRCPCHLCIAPPHTASPIDKTDISGIGHLSTNVNHIYPTFTPIRRHCHGVQFFAACKKIKLTLPIYKCQEG
jgi:hypothetical protein